MYVQRSVSGLEVQTPAKLNLFFEVLSKRDDGFHEVETLMTPINLYDSLFFQEAPSGQMMFSFRWASGADLGSVPDGNENIVVKAVQRLKQLSGVEGGVVIRLVKRIPSAAGMGGGSSDAAAALVAVNVLWKLDWPREKLMEVAAELGSDVPFFLAGGPAICRGRGERIEPVRGLAPLDVVVVCPPDGLSTALVYQHCRPSATPWPIDRPIDLLVEAMRRGHVGSVGGLLCNRLQPAAETLSPWVGRLKEQFAKLDCTGHQMSGSGTSYFGICRHRKHARRVAGQLRSRGVGNVFALRSCMN